MGSACAYQSSIITIRQNIMNHTQTVFRLGPHIPLAAYSQSKGVPYVLGETNTISVRILFYLHSNPFLLMYRLAVSRRPRALQRLCYCPLGSRLPALRSISKHLRSLF